MADQLETIYHDDRRHIEGPVQNDAIRMIIGDKQVIASLYHRGYEGSPVPANCADAVRAKGLDPDQCRIWDSAVLPIEAAQAIATWRDARLDATEAAEQARLDEHVPGLESVRNAVEAARHDQERYYDQFEQMMEDESNDGANPPHADPRLSEQADSLCQQYPRAALYVKAEDVARVASNHHKSAAANQAMTILKTGGDLETARQTLENWLPESAAWD